MTGGGPYVKILLRLMEKGDFDYASTDTVFSA